MEIIKNYLQLFLLNRKHIFVFVIILKLSGCDGAGNLSAICEQYPELCKQFAEDNFCKKERSETIFIGADLKRSNDDKDKYLLLIAYENYAKCVNRASKIEHIKLKEKQRIRVDNYLAANERIEALSAATINSEHPDLLYYHWSRYGNQRSLDKFLSMEGSALVETSNAQFNLATYYSKRDIDKTLRLLFRSLELNKTNKINTEIFKSLSSIFTERKEYKQAYIWLNILHLYDEEDETVSESTLVEFSRHHQLDAKFLAQVAKATLAKIEAGKFISPV